MIDGEAVILGVDGISDFNALHSRQHDHEVQLSAFDNRVLLEDTSSLFQTRRLGVWTFLWHGLIHA
ncbi:hypothetical protein [Bradyrhizobium zhanjiangense]|uniref:hypothetical protein n=1 Tax=Bradyrhizobium zhanjiangense TaxID=1325107 RepID=UPI0026B980E4